MKRTIALLCAGVMSASLCMSVFAVDGKRFEKGQEKRLDKMSQELSLTAEQKEKVSAICKENGEKSEAEMQQMREKHKAMREETDKRLKEVLTPEQQAKFEKIRSERKDKMEKKMKKRMGKNMEGCPNCCGDVKPGDRQCNP